MLFQNRTDAGRQLAKALPKYKARHPVVLALPRGGVRVAAEVARVLDAPLDLLLVRKIGPAKPAGACDGRRRGRRGSDRYSQYRRH
jgi:putative phosphoribosyl transferase